MNFVVTAAENIPPNRLLSLGDKGRIYITPIGGTPDYRSTGPIKKGSLVRVVIKKQSRLARRSRRRSGCMGPCGSRYAGKNHKVRREWILGSKRAYRRAAYDALQSQARDNKQQQICHDRVCIGTCKKR